MNARVWAAIALLCIVAAGGGTLWQLRSLDIGYGVRIAAQDLDQAVRNQISELFDLLRAVGARGRREFSFEDARAALQGSDTWISVYEAPRGDQDAPPRWIGACSASDDIQSHAELAVPARVPTNVFREFGEFEPLPSLAIRGEVQTERVVTMMFSDETGKLEDRADKSLLLPFGTKRVWFSPFADGEIRLNVLTTVGMRIDLFGGKSQPRTRRYLHAFAPLPLPRDANARVRCDIVDGVLRTDLPAQFPEIHGPTLAAIDPPRFPWAFPIDSDDRPRIVLGGVGSRQPAAGLIALWLLAICSVLTAFWFMRRSARTTLSESALETSHELRTPLTVLRGELEVTLRRERSNAEYRRSLETALAEVEGLQRIVTSLLVLGSDATARHFERIDLSELAASRVARLQPLHPEREISFLDSGDCEVRGDPILLERGIDNLLENAAVHSLAGGAVRVSVHSSGSTVEVVVEDDGPGVPAARREQIFERFFRGPETGTRRIPGAGLGLPVVRWIARLHGGDATLDSAVDDRARFVLRLPASS